MIIKDRDISGIVFDLDGTLVYTKPKYRYLVVGNTLNELGIKSTKDIIDRFWFESDRNKIIQEHFLIDYNIFWNEFRIWDNVELRKNFTYPYKDTEVINEIRNNGVKTGILTGAPIDIRDMEIRLTNQKFDAIISANYINGIKEKPNPEGLLKCLEEMKIKKENATIVGNGLEDIEVGRNAGVFTILVNRRSHKSQNACPDLEVKSLYKLRRFY